MRVIELSKGQVAIVDDADFMELAQYRWRFDSKGYACRWSTMVNGQRTLILMHVAIMNPPKGLDIDHRNRNGLDNRRENLRIASDSQNQANRKLNKNSKTGFKGVCFYPNEGIYVARIMKDGKSNWLGRFKTVEDARDAYNNAAINLFGEFARLN